MLFLHKWRRQKAREIWSRKKEKEKIILLTKIYKSNQVNDIRKSKGKGEIPENVILRKRKTRGPVSPLLPGCDFLQNSESPGVSLPALQNDFCLKGVRSLQFLNFASPCFSFVIVDHRKINNNELATLDWLKMPNNHFVLPVSQDWSIN